MRCAPHKAPRTASGRSLALQQGDNIASEKGATLQSELTRREGDIGKEGSACHADARIHGSDIALGRRDIRPAFQQERWCTNWHIGDLDNVTRLCD